MDWVIEQLKKEIRFNNRDVQEKTLQELSSVLQKIDLTPERRYHVVCEIEIIREPKYNLDYLDKQLKNLNPSFDKFKTFYRNTELESLMQSVKETLNDNNSLVQKLKNINSDEHGDLKNQLTEQVKKQKEEIEQLKKKIEDSKTNNTNESLTDFLEQVLKVMESQVQIGEHNQFHNL